MIALALLLVAGTPQARTIQHATITAYGAEPTVGSGYLMVLRHVQVVTAYGETLDLHFVHGSTGHYLGDRQDAPYPAVGASCDLVIEVQHGSAIVGDMGDGTIRDREIISAARC